MTAPVGALLLAAGFGLISIGSAAGAAEGTVLMVLLGVSGLGYGAAFSGTLTHLTRVVTDRYAADVSGLFNTTLQVGGVLGVAILDTVYLGLASHAGAAPARHGFTVTTFALLATALAAAAVAGLSMRDRTSVGMPGSPARPTTPPRIGWW